MSAEFEAEESRIVDATRQEQRRLKAKRKARKAEEKRLVKIRVEHERRAIRIKAEEERIAAECEAGNQKIVHPSTARSDEEMNLWRRAHGLPERHECVLCGEVFEVEEEMQQHVDAEIIRKAES